MADKKIQMRKRPCVMIIRDGWGYNPNPAEDAYNAVKQAHVPVDTMLMNEYPNCLIRTYGEDVGLPAGTMGNSEVGHQNIGAGRIVYQDSVRITLAIREGDFFRNEVLVNAVRQAKQKNRRLHLFGLCSDIGVHSLLEHLYALLELARREGLQEVYLHAFTDGRDSPPTSGAGYLKDIEAKMKEIGVGRIASVMGRFYAMDRDKRWERVQEAYECLTLGNGQKARDAVAAVQESYAANVTDEFIKPINIVDEEGKPIALVEDGDSVIFFNFRGDRPRELTRAFVEEDFSGFPRQVHPKVHYVCMTEYDASIPAPAAFPPIREMPNIAGEYFSRLGLRQFRCAETEKYAHVTFFFNCGREAPFEGEERQIVPSPKVKTYDLKPEMSANEVCEVILEKLDSDRFDVIICNFANPDMVGHTGVLAAAIKAAETVDACVGRILEKVRQKGGSALVLADHGNFEKMWDFENNMPHTAHTVGDVPMIVFDEDFKHRKMASGGRLADAAPTFLEVMGLPKPEEMTGRSLLL
ncbi:MAG TPA: 2,3-bisphosphoglycerate-independent phosphoglycerate mutase [Anaerohalosphaeraceae bacterium]|nr:2,3-bisphosphoglycerate-independent phosphoglycerate mutase [Anaerohalosphaeraceae bacterium]HPB92991.1 2,3-bisphosphoglycerate-independent phosphoglycerate mutase [Anaerohalosphaeraceae bacterium]HRT23545.1 2,3-bisphosphoglycerate-independent phosphoglycerate mutase [Anaerohalosphaeraceae bacterium]HRU15235.1 2,3-bisphosphoglycerate-independent phosphoglycerate mutase [Anaerohalosphaeraceae bacterium]